jgi:DNA-binding NtrC family response regulator
MMEAQDEKAKNAQVKPGGDDKPQPIILVIDDELGIRQLLSLVMGEQGYKVLTAADGEEGLQVAKQNRVDVVISDMKMPKMGGLDVLLALKDFNPGIEVIMLTGFSSIDSALESMKRGAYDYMTKPFQIEDLCRLVARALDKRRLNMELNELQEFSKAKSEIVATLSHEILGPAKGVLQDVAQIGKEPKGLSEKQKELLAKIENDVKHLVKAVQDRLKEVSEI